MLRLERIAKFYGNRLIFKEISLHLEPASVTLLAGHNGSGKSTLLKIMAGLSSPSAGQIRAGQATSNIKIGYLGHQTFIYPELSALENLEFWAKLHRLRKEQSVEKNLLQILERMDLAPFAHDKAGSFSRGMSQRLNLARVFLLSPDLLLLDEPGTGLDTKSASILYREIADAKKRGAAVVWISHSLKEDLLHADKLALIKEKQLAYYGLAQDFREDSSHKTTQSTLLGSCDSATLNCGITQC